MKTDSLYYRLFKELPECFFEVIGRPASDAKHFRFDAVELKDTAARLDGVFLPIDAAGEERVYFVEFQSHVSERTYSNLLLKVGLYLEKVNPSQDWQAVVFYPSRMFEQPNVRPYRLLLASDQLVRIYVDELPTPAPQQYGMQILKLIVGRPEQSLAAAQRLIPLIRTSNQPRDERDHLIELIETVMLYKLPHLGRKELEKMLQVESYRQTRVFQEGLEEGMEKGLEEGIEKGIEKGKEAAAEEFACRLLARKFAESEIAELTGLSPAQIKKLKRAGGTKKRRKSP